MSKKIVLFFIGVLLVTTMPEKISAKACYVKFNKIERRHGHFKAPKNTSSARQRIAALQNQFNTVRKNGYREKQFMQPKIISFQQERGSRPKTRRKLLHAQLDSIENTLDQLNSNRYKNKALENLNARLHTLKRYDKRRQL